MEGIILCGHGTRSPKGKDQFTELVCQFGATQRDAIVTYAFLELQKPGFEEAVAFLKEAGVTTIRVLPVFLFGGLHVNKDVPIAFRDINKKYPELAISQADYLGRNENLRRIIDRVIAWEAGRSIAEDWSDTSLVICGVGASEGDANEQIASLTEGIRSSARFYSVDYALLSSTNANSMENVFGRVALENNRTVLVVPLLLFEGYYLRKIKKETNYLQIKYGSRFTITPPFGRSEAILEILQERLLEVQKGQVNLMANIDSTLQARRNFFTKG